MKILVIEDQEGPWSNFLTILLQMCHIPAENIIRARWYTEAQAKIEEGQYDIVFLDHRMPYDDPGCTDDMETFDKFCRTLQNIGYGLLSSIREKQPQAKIVGTSSLSGGEIGRFEKPEVTLTKINLFDELPPLIESFLAK